MGERENHLQNGGFEADWEEEKSHLCVIFPKDGTPYEKRVGNIFVPPGWTFWFYHDPGTYDQPEGRDAWASDMARRAHGGAKGYSWFTFSRNHDAGLFQQVEVEAGTRVRFTAWMHGWSNNKNDELYLCWNCGNSVEIPLDGAGFAECNQCGTGLNWDCNLIFPYPGHGKWSEGAGFDKVAWEEGSQPETGYEHQDAKSNHTFWVGIDPTGGTNPLADTVVWGQGWHIYNGYVKQLEVETVAEADTVTVFVRSRTKYPFTHNDVYVDDAELVVVEEPPTPPPPPPTPQDEVVLTIDLTEPEVGDEVTATAVSESHLSNVQFIVAFAGKDYPFGVLTSTETDGVYTWTTTFTVNDPGLYSVAVTSDTCSDVLSFTVSQSATPGRGEPREQYERTYVLLPPDADKSWALAVVGATWDKRRFTIGGSADDAGIGDLDVRRVIAVNPGDWLGPQTLFDFFTQHYPGVEYIPVEAGTLEELAQELDELMEWPPVTPPPPPPPPPPVLPPPEFPQRGGHDLQFAEWLVGQGLSGWCVEAVYLGLSPRKIEGLERLADKGVRVLLNLRYSYARGGKDGGGQGTLPVWDDLGAFVDACVETMRLNPATWGFTLANEFNNPREWPEGGEVTPEMYSQFYNQVYTRKPAGARVLPGAIDPYNAQAAVWGDWRKTWRWVLDNILGADGLTFHCYTHGPEVQRIRSEQIFTNAPLIGVYYDLRVLENQQEIVPARFAALPQIVTETNPDADGAVGWTDDGEWVREAAAYFAERGVNGWCLFRYNHNDWRFGDKPQVMEAIRAV